MGRSYAEGANCYWMLLFCRFGLWRHSRHSPNRQNCTIKAPAGRVPGLPGYPLAGGVVVPPGVYPFPNPNAEALGERAGPPHLDQGRTTTHGGLLRRGRQPGTPWVCWTVLILPNRLWLGGSAAQPEPIWQNLPIKAPAGRVPGLPGYHGLRVGYPWSLLGVVSSLIQMRRPCQLQGDTESARKLLARAEGSLRSMDAPGWKKSLMDIQLYQARLHLDRDESDTARTCLDERETMRATAQPGQPDRLGLIVRSQVSLREGDAPGAVRRASEALRAFGEDACYGWRAVAQLCLGERHTRHREHAASLPGNSPFVRHRKPARVPGPVVREAAPIFRNNTASSPARPQGSSR